MTIVTDLEKLRVPCIEATEVINVEAMAAALLYDMKKYGGCGLAANQVGFKHRVCVIAVGDMTPIVLVNPLIIKEKKPRRVREGCLSLPGLEVEIERPMYVKVKAMDEHWNTRKYTFTGTQAQVARHEIDHLNGILMIDYLEASDREVKERLLRGAVYKRKTGLEGLVE